MDPTLQLALERQLALLAPVSRSLTEAAAHPPRVSERDWRGPSAETYRGLEAGMARLLGSADAAVLEVVRELRLALAGASG